MQLNVNEFVLTELDPECGLAQPQLVVLKNGNSSVGPTPPMETNSVMLYLEIREI